jgi:hypothetical protein
MDMYLIWDRDMFVNVLNTTMEKMVAGYLCNMFFRHLLGKQEIHIS